MRPEWLFVMAATIGASVPPLSVCQRGVLHGIHDHERRRWAFELDASLGATVYAVGPLFIALAGFALKAAELGSGLLVFGGTLSFMFTPLARRWRPSLDDDDRGKPAIKRPAVLALALITLGIGANGGAIEMALVGYAHDHHVRSHLWVMLGCWQVGSAAGKLALKPLLPKRINPLTELTAWLVVLAATGVLLSFAPNFPLMCVFIVAAGIPVAASYGVLNLQVGTFAKPRVLEGNSVTNTGMLAGVSLGAAGCGVFVDHHGPRATFCVAAVVAALTATLAAGCRPWLTRRAAAIRRESYERGEPIALHHVWSHPVVGDFLGPPIEAGASKFLALVVSRNATARDRVLPELGNLGLRIVGVDPSRLRPRYADMEETVILMRPSRQVAAVVPLQDRSVRPVAVQAIGEWPMAQ